MKNTNKKKTMNELLMETRPHKSNEPEIEAVDDLPVAEDKVNVDDEVNKNESQITDQAKEDDELTKDVIDEGIEAYESEDDDEFILSIQDEVLESDRLSALVEQVDIDENENLIYFKINGVFDENSKDLRYNKRGELIKNPPTLEVADMNDNSVHFNLTKEITRELIESLEEVQRAYYGYSTPKRESNAESLYERVEEFFKESPMKALVAILVIIVFIIAVFK